MGLEDGTGTFGCVNVLKSTLNSLAQVAANDEPAEDRLDLGDAGAAGVRGEHPHEAGGEGGEPDGPQHVQEVHDEVGPGPVGALREAEHLGPRKPVRAVAGDVDDGLV